VLRSLEELGLVRKDDCGYYVTRNGLMLLDAYRRFRTSLEVYGIKP
jgi:ribosomal protein S19E (S16A)